MTDNECSHPRLIHVVNREDGGEASTCYKCEKCHDLLTVAIKPFKIEVVFGAPKTVTGSDGKQYPIGDPNIPG